MAKHQAQIGLDDKWIEDAELEDLLAEREELNEARKAAVKAFKEKDAVARERIAVYDIETGTYRRCGPYLIEATMTEPKPVNYDTTGGRRLSISNAEAKEPEGDDDKVRNFPAENA